MNQVKIKPLSFNFLLSGLSVAVRDEIHAVAERGLRHRRAEEQQAKEQQPKAQRLDSLLHAPVVDEL